jgi:uric acid transporter
MHSGISATAIVAVVLNLLFNEIRLGKKPGASVMAAAEEHRDKLGDTLDDELRQPKPDPDDTSLTTRASAERTAPHD